MWSHIIFAQSGKYHLLELPRRVMGHRKRIEDQETRLQIGSEYKLQSGGPEDAMEIPLPPVQIVDLRQRLRAGNRSIFSRALAQAVDDTLDRGEQAILFLNRRGTATFIICRDCGHILRCPRCDMPLTYHRPRMMLVCHHCGRQSRHIRFAHSVDQNASNTLVSVRGSAGACSAAMA